MNGLHGPTRVPVKRSVFLGAATVNVPTASHAEQMTLVQFMVDGKPRNLTVSHHEAHVLVGRVVEQLASQGCGWANDVASFLNEIEEAYEAGGEDEEEFPDHDEEGFEP